jgi:GR25 family glycosyltransferase involved in LPS biosynthesis
MINELLYNFFDEIYCINLKNREDRWKSFLNEMERLNITNVKRFDAVNGRELDYSNLIYNRNLLPGELGVLMSHINLIKEAKEKNLESILIMEDDVYFTDEIYKLNDYLNSVPEDWNFIYFGGNHGQYTPEIVNNRTCRLKNSFGLQCVAIKNTMYDRILNDAIKLEKQIDVYYASYQSENKSYCFNPNMALQKVDYSDIQNRVVDYTHFFKN